MNDDLFAKLVRNEITESTYLNGGKPVGYEVGARVQALHAVGKNSIYDAQGTIRLIRGRNNHELLVEWDAPVRGHYGNGGKVYIESGRGWYIDKENTKLI